MGLTALVMVPVMVLIMMAAAAVVTVDMAALRSDSYTRLPQYRQYCSVHTGHTSQSSSV